MTVTDAELLRESRLSNGMRVVTERMPGARSVSLAAWVAVGGRDEPDRLAGASHFLEHLLLKGTEQRSARQIAEAVDAVGGDVNAFTSREHTAYYLRLPAQHADLGWDILADVLTAPAFRPHEVEGERQVILEEILMNLDVPEDHVHTLLAEAVYPDHPLGREVLGTAESVRAMTRDEITDFFARWYLPANIIVVAAGDLDHDAVVARLEGAVGHVRGGERPRRQRPEEPPRPVAGYRADTEQVHLTLGWRGLDDFDEDRYALALANQVLGGGMASRLFQEVREERGLCYAVYSWASTHADAGSAGVYAGCTPARAGELLEVVEAEVASLARDGVTEKELATARGYMEGSLVLGLEDSGSRMAYLGRSLVSRGEVVPVDRHLARFAAVTADDVVRVARQVYESPRSLAVIGPLDPASLV